MWQVFIAGKDKMLPRTLPASAIVTRAHLSADVTLPTLRMAVKFTFDIRIEKKINILIAKLTKITFEYV